MISVRRPSSVLWRSDSPAETKRLFLIKGVNLLLGKMAITRCSDCLTDRDTAPGSTTNIADGSKSTSHEKRLVISAPHLRETDDRAATTYWIGRGTRVLCPRRGCAVPRYGLVAFPRAPPLPLRRGSPISGGRKAVSDRNPKAEVFQCPSVRGLPGSV
jgi:hypothetical protein